MPSAVPGTSYVRCTDSSGSRRYRSRCPGAPPASTSTRVISTVESESKRQSASTRMRWYRSVATCPRSVCDWIVRDVEKATSVGIGIAPFRSGSCGRVRVPSGPDSGLREVDGEPHVGLLLLIASDVLGAGDDPDAHPDGVVVRAEDGPSVPVIGRDLRHEQVVDVGDDPVIRLPPRIRRLPKRPSPADILHRRDARPCLPVRLDALDGAELLPRAPVVLLPGLGPGLDGDVGL